MIPAFILFEALFLFVLIVQKMGALNPWTYLLILAPLLLFLHIWLVINSTELALTNKRVIAKTGIFTQQTSELLLGQIESVEVEQGLLGRFLNYGTVTVKGTGGGAAPASGIVDPMAFRRAVQELPRTET